MNHSASVRSWLRGSRTLWIAAAIAIVLILAWVRVALSFPDSGTIVRSDAIYGDAYLVQRNGDLYTITREGKPWVSLLRTGRDVILRDSTRHDIKVAVIHPDNVKVEPSKSTK